MITLAIAELLHALAPQLKGWFGGESGISAMRMPAWGLTFGSTIAGLLPHARLGAGCRWRCCTSTRRTPLGRLTLALRENAHRLRFLGYDVHGLGVSAFAISAMFSGIAGGLQAISNEAANYVVFDAGVSAAVVLNSYIGGVGSFLGPALGAALMTFFGYAVSDRRSRGCSTRASLFVLVMMFMPAGLTGLFGAAARLVGAARLAARAAAVLLLAVAAARAAGGRRGLRRRDAAAAVSQDYRSLAAMAQRLAADPAVRSQLGAVGRSPPGSCRSRCWRRRRAGLGWRAAALALDAGAQRTTPRAAPTQRAGAA